ncbi:MAG: hypothetical protein IT371_23120 [Deltaproteobacteria bacterium]|nr:hypothetical protein [Deltaproteobacteria bacterium]
MKLWLVIFAATYLLELPVYALFLRRFLSASRLVGFTLLINLVTHPFIFLALPKWMQNPVHYSLLAELVAVSVEGVLLYALARRQRWEGTSALWCLGLAFFANAVSATLGELGYYALDKLGVPLA